MAVTEKQMKAMAARARRRQRVKRIAVGGVVVGGTALAIQQVLSRTGRRGQARRLRDPRPKRLTRKEALRAVEDVDADRFINGVFAFFGKLLAFTGLTTDPFPGRKGPPRRKPPSFRLRSGKLFGG